MENKQNKEIDVLGLALTVLKDWKTLLRFTGVAAVIGVVVAISTPREYTSDVILAPEMSSGGLGLSSNLADMASSFGIDLGKKTSMDAIYPELYPDVFSSTDFILNLFEVPVRLKDDDTPRTYLKHLLLDTRKPFWEYPKGWISKLIKKQETPGAGKNVKDPYRLSTVDTEICKWISSNITCLIDKKTSEITISVTDQDPMVASIMADTLQQRLQNYITEYRTKKARVDYDYYKKMADESKARYTKSQKEYASYADANLEVDLKSFKLKEEELENEMQLQYNAYTQMTTQMKMAEAKIQERTPAFTVIQNAYMPVKPSSRSKALTVLIFIVLGGLVDAAWVLGGRKVFKKHKR